MKITLDSKRHNDFSAEDMEAFDEKLQQVEGLVGWSYSPRNGELILDFGTTDEEALEQRINAAINEIAQNCPRAELKSVTVWEIQKEWSS
ncbi:MAG: hypothetical protein NWE98_00370 [Candidatus Bathyarchaeota archaeon]|nr:hypothetical protein [Candidatus Bathyarchaeota archaeon]